MGKLGMVPNVLSYPVKKKRQTIPLRWVKKHCGWHKYILNERENVKKKRIKNSPGRKKKKKNVIRGVGTAGGGATQRE